MKKNKLPVYKISIDPSLAEGEEKLGIEQIAYTKDPAILKLGVAFDKQSEKTKIMFADELKYRVAAPAMIPMQIYRLSDDIGEYYIEFTAEQIETLVADFMQHRSKSIFNLDHKRELEAPAYILQSWIIEDPETDPSYTQYGIEGLVKGTWFVVSQFTDKDYFQKEILEAGRTGYSIEGLLGLTLSKIKEQIKQMKENTNPETVAQIDATEIVKEIKQLKAEILAESTPEQIIALLQKEIALLKAQLKPATIEAEVETPEKVEAAEEAPVETPVEEPKEAKVDEAQILGIVQPKFDELYKQIAELKTLLEGKSEPAEEAVEMVKQSDLSVGQVGFQNLMKFISKK